MPNLAVLYLQGNPCVKQTKHYRRTYIARIPTLKFLDDRPVFDDERERAEAFYQVIANGACVHARVCMYVCVYCTLCYTYPIITATAHCYHSFLSPLLCPS